ncbi:MAG: ribonuclease Z [Frankiaceae bacterium]
MTARDLIVLGTASQVPTRRRNHNGYLLRWDGEGILLDPGEGTQRQLTLAGVPASTITRICLTHLHGDHCLGLPGVIQRLSLDGVGHPVHLYFPSSGASHVANLLGATIHRSAVEVVLHPVDQPGRAGDATAVVVDRVATAALVAVGLDHGVDTLGWRVEEPDGRRMLPDRLAAAGVHGPAVGRLRREGLLDVDGRQVTLAEVSAPRRGQAFGFVMDTRACTGAEALAERADLLVCESTFLHRDEGLATAYGHLTARQAARLAADAGAARLVLTHFSQRYDDPGDFAADADPAFRGAHVAADLDRVELPPRR